VFVYPENKFHACVCDLPETDYCNMSILHPIYCTFKDPLNDEHQSATVLHQHGGDSCLTNSVTPEPEGS
jgi:hypothetical protein